jgi:MFS family permease
MKKEPENRRFTVYYGWIIVALAFVTLTIAFGVWYSFSVFLLALIEEFGWSRAATSSIFSVFLIGHAVMGILTGHLQDRFGPRIVIPFGGILLTAALALTSQANTLWQFYITYGVFASIGVSLIGFTSHSAFLPNWFVRKRGLAVGIAMSGIGFGMLLLVPLLEKIITVFGWRTAELCAAAAVLFMVVPLNFLLARKSPAELGLLPDGRVENAPLPKTRQRAVQIIDHAWAEKDWTLSKAVATRRFWFVGLAFIFISFAYQSTLLHSVSAMVDGGLNRELAALFFGIAGIAGSGGKIMFGYLSDMFGRERITTAGGIIAGLGIVCLIFTGSAGIILPLMFAVLFGLGYGAAAPLLPSVSADIFEGRSFGLIFAMIAIGGGLGGSSGAFVAGLIRDVTGSYTASLLVAIVSLSLSCTMIWLARPGKVRKIIWESVSSSS